MEKAYQLLPPLSVDEYEALKSDIRERGVMVPVEYDEQGNILDGHHRQQIADELGITDFPSFVRHGMTEEEKRAHVIALNVQRRHLTKEQRDALAVKLRGEGWSYPRIAEALNTGKATVERALESAPPFPNGKPDTDADSTAAARVTGKDGKSYPARKRKTTFRGDSATRAERHRKEPPAPKPASPLPPSKFSLIYADPPWKYRDCEPSRSPDKHYPLMDTAEIQALPVAGLAARDCVLFLWATSAMIPEAFSVIRSWGFAYKTVAVWVKHGRVGMGYYFRQDHELLLLATKGAPGTPAYPDRPSSVIDSRKGKHSEKPAAAYEVIERMYPEAKRIELFARASRDGWKAWGNEVSDER